MKPAIVLLAVTFAACTANPVVLATLPGSDGGAPAQGPRCTQLADCGAGNYCDKETCATPAGNCRPYPSFCNEVLQPVCGCDGITYFNDCLRRTAGIAAAGSGPCEFDAVSCDPAHACPGDASCARLSGSNESACQTPPPGRCWILPPTCPAPTGIDRWARCGPADGPRCVDTCVAIQSGNVYRREDHCD